MQAHHHACDDGADAGELHDLSDELLAGICHDYFPSPELRAACPACAGRLRQAGYSRSGRGTSIISCCGSSLGPPATLTLPNFISRRRSSSDFAIFSSLEPTSFTLTCTRSARAATASTKVAASCIAARSVGLAVAVPLADSPLARGAAPFRFVGWGASPFVRFVLTDRGTATSLLATAQRSPIKSIRRSLLPDFRPRVRVCASSVPRQGM